MMTQNKEYYKKIRELLKRTNAKAWTQLIEKAGEHGAREARYLDIIIHLAKQYFFDIGSKEIKYLEFKEKDPKNTELKPYHKYIAASEDGSMAPGDSISMMYYVVISSAIVLFEGYSEESIKNPLVEVHPDLVPYPLQKDLSLIKREASLEMMRRETRAMNEALQHIFSKNSPAILMTDGPIIDPPQPVKDEKYEDLVNLRAGAIRNAISSDVLLVGFVKRVIGNIYTSSLKNVLEKYQHKLDKDTKISLTNIGDYALASLLFELKRKVLEDRSNEDFILYTHPKEVPDNEIRAYKDYKDKGVFVYYSLVKLSGWKYPKLPVYRIEIPFLERPSEKELIERFELSLKLLYLWTPAGLKYPLPISLAHQNCTIKKPIAKVLVREILSRFASSYAKNISVLDEDLLKYYLLERVV